MVEMDDALIAWRGSTSSKFPSSFTRICILVHVADLLFVSKRLMHEGTEED